MARAIWLLGILGYASSPALAEDAPDWSKFANHSKIQGIVVSADLEKIVLAIPALEKRENNGQGMNRNRGRGGGQRRPNVRLGSEEITIHYAPAGGVRWAKAPHGADNKPVTGKELDMLRRPIGAPGFHAEKTELRPGHVVEIQLVRPAEVSSTKATPNDLSIKYATIVGETDVPKGKGDNKAK